MQQLSQVPQMAEDGIQVGKIPRQLLAPFKNYILKIIWVTFAKFGSDPSTPWDKPLAHVKFDCLNLQQEGRK